MYPGGIKLKLQPKNTYGEMNIYINIDGSVFVWDYYGIDLALSWEYLKI